MNEQQIDELIKQALQTEAQLPKGLEARLSAHIDALAAAEQPRIQPRSHHSWWIRIGGIAAAFAGALLWIALERPSEPPIMADTFSDPKEAALVAEKALVLLSQNLNKGLEQAQASAEEMRQINQIINKHLKE